MKNKKVSIIYYLVSVGLILGCLEVKDEDLIKENALTTKNKIVGIGNAGIEIPLGYYGLFRKGNKVCAVRFLESGKNKQQEGFVWDRMYYNYSIYEWYYTEDNNFKEKNVKHGIGKSTSYQIPFLGTPGVSFDNFDIKCDKLYMKRDHWLVLYFITGKTYKMTREEIEKEIENEGFEIAPTKWKNIEEVDLNDKRLKWYKGLPVKRLTDISIDDLW